MLDLSQPMFIMYYLANSLKILFTLKTLKRHLLKTPFLHRLSKYQPHHLLPKVLSTTFLGLWNAPVVLILWKNPLLSLKSKDPLNFWLTESSISFFLLLALQATAMVNNFNSIVSSSLFLVLVNYRYYVIQFKIPRLSLGLAL